MKKFITAAEAACLVRDGDTLALGGFGAYCGPDGLMEALGERYRRTGKPQGLTTVAGISCGDNTEDNVGVNRIAIPGLLKRHIAAHVANPVRLRSLVDKNEIAAYGLPLGVIMNLWRAIASGKPGVLTSIGLGTFADPLFDGCRINEKAERENRHVVRRVSIGEKDYLFFPSFPINICFIRGSYADIDGNISVERDALINAELEIAAATRNSGGIVVAQVEEVKEDGPIPAQRVRIHRTLVDYIAVVPKELSLQSYASAHDRPELSGLARAELDTIKPLPLSSRKIIARRAAMELTPGCVINLGIGMPSGVGNVANEEGISSLLSMESGPIGGIPVEGLGFGAAVNPEAIFSCCDVLDLYDGGFLDMSFLGCAQIDEAGNVNVSRFGGRCTGPGGFVDISQNTPKLFFLSMFAASQGTKFVKKVQQITFSADYARKIGQQVAYLTERAVFRLSEDGITLTEIAPGLDLEKDILPYMEFKPYIARNLKVMDERLFREERMGLAL